MLCIFLVRLVTNQDKTSGAPGQSILFFEKIIAAVNIAVEK